MDEEEDGKSQTFRCLKRSAENDHDEDGSLDGKRNKVDSRRKELHGDELIGQLSKKVEMGVGNPACLAWLGPRPAPGGLGGTVGQ